MSNAFKVFAACCIASAALSCSLLSFEELETCVSLFEEQTYSANEIVKIDFSISMDKASIESLLSLKEDGQRVDARIDWLGSSCFVQARGGFIKGRKYILNLQGPAYAADGRAYAVNIYREFIFGTEADRFSLNAVKEEKDGRGDIESLLFTFNKAIDPATFEREFNISPYIELNKDYSTDFLTVKMSPKDKWKANVYYAWKLGNMASADGTKIFKEYEGSFLGAKKEKEPELLKACPVVGKTFLESESLDDLLERQAIGLIFDCEMDKDSVKNGVYFTPAAQGYWESDDLRRFVFTPSKNYLVGTKYRLTISDSVEDKWGIKFKDERNIYFLQKTSFIDVEKITLNTIEISENQENKIKACQDAPAYFRIVFTKALDNRSLLELKSAVKFEGLFPASLQSPRLRSITIISSNSVEFCYENINAADTGQDCVFKLTIRGGENFIYNSIGECLKEDKCYCISITKN